jgi:hypothetical protein
MQHPTTPGGENEPVFTSFLFFGLFLDLAWAGGCFKTKHQDLLPGLHVGKPRRGLADSPPVVPCVIAALS